MKRKRMSIRAFAESRSNDESNYFKALSEYKVFFEDIYFIETKHRNVFTPLWNNNKILILEKKSTYI